MEVTALNKEDEYNKQEGDGKSKGTLPKVDTKFLINTLLKGKII